MLSKEEIESHIDLVKLPQYKANSTEIALVEYIDQLEQSNQKLIEKLEEDILNADDNIKHMNEKNILQIIARELATGMRDYAQEILSLLKGEKEWEK